MSAPCALLNVQAVAVKNEAAVGSEGLTVVDSRVAACLSI